MLLELRVCDVTQEEPGGGGWRHLLVLAVGGGDLEIILGSFLEGALDLFVLKSFIVKNAQHLLADLSEKTESLEI